MLKLLSLTIIIALSSAVTIPEIQLAASRRIPVLRKPGFLRRIPHSERLKVQISAGNDEQVGGSTKIVFRGVAFTYLAPTILRLRECFYGNPPVSEVEMFSTVVNVKYENGSSEIIPILSWTGDGEGKIRALTLQIGPQTIVLLVRAE